MRQAVPARARRTSVRVCDCSKEWDFRKGAMASSVVFLRSGNE